MPPEPRMVEMAEPLSPEDIENVTFPTSLRGYDRDSVDIFLQEVATAFESVWSEAQAARSGAQKPYRSLGEEMGDLLQHAKDSAEQTKRVAEDEARRLREKAAEDGAATVAAAENQAAELRAVAEREAAEKVQDAADTVAQLEAMETEAREELRELRRKLESLTEQLRALESTKEPAMESAAATPPRPEATSSNGGPDTETISIDSGSSPQFADEPLS
jgi:DivIVA domain-containing protein